MPPLPSPQHRPHPLPPPIPAPTLGAGGTFTIACSTRLAAPPRRCLDVILDAPSYPKWNPFCRACTITAPGLPTETTTLLFDTKFTFDVHLPPATSDGPGRPTHLQVSVLEPIDEPGRKGWRVAWRTDGEAGGVPTWLLRAERTQEFVEVEVEGRAETAYACWETFFGPMAWVVRLAVGGGWRRGLGVDGGVEGVVEGR